MRIRMFNYRTCLLILLWFILQETILTAQISETSELDRYIENTMETFQVPGLSLAIIKNDSVIFLKGYGICQYGTDVPVDENTLFAIGSISKSTTALALSILEDQDELRWQDKVSKYLPDFQMYDPWVTQEISITDLLTHRSGLRSVSGGTIWYGSDFSREEVVYRIRYLQPVSSFRSTYAYQNVMYVVAGQIIPAITGKSWDEYIRETVLSPLDMRRTTTRMSELQAMTNVAKPHILQNGELRVIPHRDYDNIGPAASIYSSARDMAQYVRLLLNSGHFNNNQIVSAKNVNELFMPHMTLPIPDYTGKMARRQPQFRAYGYGWFIEDYNGQKIVRHSGGVDGFRALVAMLPSEDFGVVVLTNQEQYRLYYAVFYKLLDDYLGFPDYHWDRVFKEELSQSGEDQKQERNETALPMSLSLIDYAGVYYDRMVEEINVELAEDQLTLTFSHTPSFRAELTHWQEDTFRSKWNDPTIPDGFVTFEISEEGNITGLTFDQPKLLDVDFDELNVIRR